MDLKTEVKIATFLGILTIILLACTGIFLPQIISSTMPLFLIILIVVLWIVSLPIVAINFYKLLILKNTIGKINNEKVRTTKNNSKKIKVSSK